MGTVSHDSLGYDCFARPAGQVESMNCNVCGTECTVERNRPGIRKWYVGGTGMGQDHDLFTCPNAEAEWHRKALELLQEIEKTPSRRVAELMALDLADVLAENGIGFRPEMPQ